MDERAFFDNLAPVWDENETESTPQRVEYVMSFFGLKPGDKVLDLGTGTGVLLPFIAQRIGREGEITAVDFSDGMLQRAVAKFGALSPKPMFLNIDFENDTIPGSYDKIILYCVFPHLHTPIETLKWLRAVNLNPGGSIIIAFPTGPEFINNIHRERHSDSDILPTAHQLAGRLVAHGLEATVANADDHSYVVIINK